MRFIFFVCIFIINLWLIIIGDNEYREYKKAINKSMLPYELQDVFDFEDDGTVVIVRGSENKITYVIRKDEPIKLQICREKLEKCKHNLGEKKQINFCYNSQNIDPFHQENHPCGNELHGFLIREDRVPDNPNFYVEALTQSSDDPHDNGLQFGGCKDATIVKEDSKYWLKIKDATRKFEISPLPQDFQFQDESDLRFIQLQISSSNKVCGFYFKFMNGFFPIYEWVDPPAPPAPPSTSTTTSTTTTSTVASLPSIAMPLSAKPQSTKIIYFATTQPSVAESFLLQWILIGIGSLIIVALIVASIFCCFRHKFTKPRRSKKSLTDKKIPEQPVSLPPSSEGGGQGTLQQQSSEGGPKTSVIDFRKKQDLQNPTIIKKGSNIKSLQTAIPPPEGLRGLKNTDELYRLALTAETREERNVYLDCAIENANEEIQIWQNSAMSQTGDISMLPAISKRIINAKKAGVKLIPTKDPTKLIPEQMDGLTYEQINDLSLIEYYPNVRYSLFERAAELIKRAFEDSAPDAHFDKDTIEPLLYQYQLGIHEINEEPHKNLEKRMKMVDEILRKKELKENDK